MYKSTDKKTHEQATAKFFNVKSTEKAKPFKRDSFSKSGLMHIDNLADENLHTVLDVGCGPGGVLLGIGEKTKEKLIGVDLSQSALDLAKKRFDEFNPKTSVEFQQGSFLDIKPQNVDGLSLHRVLCCHPNVEDMVHTTIDWDPKVILITIPQNKWIYRRLTGLMARLKRFTGGFRSFIHDPEYVTTELKSNGYVLTDLKKWFLWETHRYEKNAVNTQSNEAETKN